MFYIRIALITSARVLQMIAYVIALGNYKDKAVFYSFKAFFSLETFYFRALY
jgi:hypothetical protein